jgi:type IV pilus assembly protein PilC
MIDAGEISGQLPFVMRQIVVFLQSREDLKKKTINAFLYPALLLTLALFTILVFVFRVVPIFEELFSTFGGKLPVFTSVIISGSNFARRYFIVVAIVAGILGFIVKRALSTKPGRRLYETMLLNTPVAGNLFLALSIEKFASTLGVLLKSGIPIIRALEVAVKTSQSLIFSERVEEAKVKVMGGLPFSEALLQTSIFPPLAVQLVLVAEKTGNFSGMLEEISKYYNDIIDVAVTRFTTLIGPIVLIFMAFVIGALIIAMFLPIFKFASLG